MPEKQVTKMKIKVDLACDKCRKKIKKVLCAIPQIQNQDYNKKDNVVSITVLCCNPEKVKKKIYCTGGKTVQDIEIIKEEKPPKTTKTPEKSKTEDPPKKCCEERCGGPCSGCHKPCYGCHGRPFCECWVYSYNRPFCPSSCNYYICEENPYPCTIM